MPGSIFASRPLVECVPRNGTPNFITKLENGVPEVRIAYFGGSITAQTGYRIYSCEYIQRLFPNTRVRGINAAIGGTATDLGVFRCRHDVIDYNPDLVVVEFAVNDNVLESDDTRRNLEGIVRQIRAACPETDIVFVYTVVANHEKNLLEGTMERSSSTMEEIADHYGIPSINFGASIAPLLREGKLELTSVSKPLERVSGDELDVAVPLNAEGKIPFAPDGVHPYLNTGHVLYERAIERSAPIIRQSSRLSGKVRHYRMPKAMRKDCLSSVASVSFNDQRITITGEWKPAGESHPVCSPFSRWCEGFTVFEPGGTIMFKFKGSKAAIYDIIGPESTTLLVSVDGGEEKSVPRFDGYCIYHRLALMTICSGLNPKKEHSVRIRVATEPTDKRAILFSRNKADYDSNPDKYAPNHYFAGCLFVSGSIL